MPVPPRSRPLLTRVRRAHWLVPLLLTLVSAAVLFTRLDEPATIVFDEVYYVGDARNYLEAGVEDSFAVHPPAGKWLIALGIAVVGDDPVGWRAASALAGTATVLLTYLLGLRLLRRRSLAALAGVLVLTDGLLFVQARTSMLDIFLAMFVTLAAWALVVDHDRRRLGAAHDPVVDADPPTRDPADEAAAHTSDDEPVEAEPAEGADADGVVATPPSRSGGHRWIAGLALGLAIATKWSGILALGAAGLLVLGWELAVRWRRDGNPLRRLGRAAGSVGATLVLVPALVYAASWIPWLVSYEQASPSERCEAPADGHVTLLDRVEGLWCFHGAIWRFHRGLDADHPYRAPAYSWPVLARPVVYYWETCSADRAAGVATQNEDGELVEPEPCVVGQGQAAEIVALGNPVLWWLFIPGVVALLAGAVARDPRAWFVLAFWAVQFAPWLVPPMGGRPAFLFYMTPVVPFLALGLAYAARVIGEGRDLTLPALGALATAAVALGAGFVLDAGSPGRWLWAGAGYLVGAIVGGAAARRRGGLVPRPAPSSRRAGDTVALVVGLLAVIAFVYFYPVLAALPLAEEAVRHRWWIQPGWI